MKNVFICLVGLAPLLIACQKEAGLQDPDAVQGGMSTSGQLLRAVAVDGTDSSITTYAYDAAGRLSFFDASATNAATLTCQIRRNAAGLMTQTIIKSDELRVIGLDSLVANVYANASTSRYTYLSYRYTLGSIATADSIVFVYDGAGNLTSAVTYEKVSAAAYSPLSRTDYGYTGTNVTSEKDYDYNTATAAWVQSYQATYGYDAKSNPLKLGADGIILGFITDAGNNNPVSETSAGTTVNTTYTYNAAAKPLGGTRVNSGTSGGSTTTLRYSYN